MVKKVNQSVMTVNKNFTTKNAVDHIRKAIIHEVIDTYPAEEGLHIAQFAANHGTKVNSLDSLVQFLQDTIDSNCSKLNEQGYLIKDTYTSLVEETWKYLLTLKV